MEVSEDRGIECRGISFNYVDGKITLKVYQNLPGISRDLAGVTFEKSFSPNDWGEINSFLMKLHEMTKGFPEDDIEIVRDDEDGVDEVRELKIPIVGDAAEREDYEVTTIHSERIDSSVSSIPKMIGKEEDGKE